MTARIRTRPAALSACQADLPGALASAAPHRGGSPVLAGPVARPALVTIAYPQPVTFTTTFCLQVKCPGAVAVPARQFDIARPAAFPALSADPRRNVIPEDPRRIASFDAGPVRPGRVFRGAPEQI